MRAFLSLIPRLKAHRRGVAAVEFAAAAPLLLLLFLGTVQLTEAVATKRKIAVTTRALADLTTQYTSLSSSETDSLLSATAQIMAPYNPAPGTYRVSQVYVDASGAAKIMWSKARNGSARATGSSIAVPSGIAQNDSYVILAETSYPFQPRYLSGVMSPLTLKEAIYMYPRRSERVDQQ